MATLAPPAFPAILTNKDWQKNKGLLSKAAGETGVGAQMDKVQVAFNAVKWPTFYAHNVCSKENGVLLPGHVTAKIADITKEYSSKVEPLRKELEKLSKIADDTATAWKKSKTIPSSSTKHAAAVSTAASNFMTAVKSNGIYFTQVNTEFEAEKTRLQRLVDIAAKGVRTKIAQLKVDASGVIATPTVAQFTGTASAGFYQRIRGIGADLAALSADPKIDAFRTSTWLGFAKAGFLPKKDEEVKPKVKEVLTKLPVLEGLLP